MNARVSSNTSRPIDAQLERIIEAAIGRLQDGQAVDLDQLIAEHPSYTEQLLELFPTVELLVGMGNATVDPAAEVATNDRPASLPHQQLGDFRLVRELGRGGMGTVFEAEQLSMGRRIALKVLPFAALAHDKSLQRFRNEVRAAAALDHPHIVSVYSVGEERGVHFYAMQLIRGQTLADLICELRRSRQTPSPRHGESRAPHSFPEREELVGDTPTIELATNSVLATKGDGQARISTAVDSRQTAEYFRAAARLGIQAAEALQHAHDLGVLHRDVKPSNLMLDADGKLYVTDFGLARIESDAGLTMTGDVVGTLRYMAPEQALAKRVVVDNRADVYSLGATLYELLTLQPAFAETDRKDLLKQIAFDEPLPLRKLDRQIPVELEIIVLKAMANQREDRYQSAQQLADDLIAFCEFRPIAARAISLTDRLRKWTWRHQAVVAIFGVALVLLLVVLAISMAVMTRAESRTVAALEETSDLLYTADMTVAYQCFEKGWLDEVQTILDRQRPVKGKLDRRGFEWHLLQSLVRRPVSMTLAGHDGPVNELAVFADRVKVASVGDDGTLRIWDMTSRQLLKTITICDKALNSVAVSPDSRFVAVGSTSLYLCDLASDYQVSKLYDNDFTIESIAFTADSKQLAVGARYDHVALIALDGQVAKSIPCGARVESLEYVEGTGLLLVPNRRPIPRKEPVAMVQLWGDDLSDMKQEFDASQAEQSGLISIARSSPCGRFVAAGARRAAKSYLFERSSGRVIAETPVSRDWVTDLAYSPKGAAIAVGYQNGRIEYFDLQMDAGGTPQFNRRPVVIDAHQGEVACTRFINADTLVSCGADGLIRIWDLPADTTQTFELTDQRLSGMELSRDGCRLLYVCHHEIVLVDLDRGDVVFRRSQADAHYYKPAWAPRGDKAVVCDETTRSVIVLDRTGKTICSIPSGVRPEAAAFSPDGSLLAIVDAEQLRLCRAIDGGEIVRQPLPTSHVAFSRDGTRLVCGGIDATNVVFDVSTMQTLHTLDCASNVYCLTFSPDDSVIASGHGDSVIRIWDTDSGRLRAELVGHEQAIRCLEFSPDGRTLLSSAEDGSVRVWSVHRGQSYGAIYRRSRSGSGPVACEVSVAPDRRLIAIGYRTQLVDFPDVLLLNVDQAAEN